MAQETWPNSPNETTGVMQMAIRLSVLGMEPFISKGIADLEDPGLSGKVYGETGQAIRDPPGGTEGG